MEFEQVRDIIVETLGCDAEQVTMDASLADDLGADSLASVELVMALEEATGISIEDSALAEMKTVGDVMNYLNAHKQDFMQEDTQAGSLSAEKGIRHDKSRDF